MESCWEDDGGARLTVQCVHERIKQLIYEPPDDTYNQTYLDKLKTTFLHECSNQSSVCSNSSGSELYTNLRSIKMSSFDYRIV